jgi:hypothetical protein
MPGDPADEAMFESRPIPLEAWRAFEGSDLWQRMHALEHEGIIASFEEFSFSAQQLPQFINLLESNLAAAPAPARAWLSELTHFSKRAQERGVGLTFTLSG